MWTELREWEPGHRVVFHTSVFDKWKKVVCFLELFWNEFNWHFHVFESVQWGYQVHVFDIYAHVLDIWGAYNTAPHYFCGGQT